MKVVGLQSFGPPTVLELLDLDDPQPAPGQVVVAVAAATVNPTDTLLRSGQQAASMTQLEPPYIPGMEFSGRVHQLGKDTSGLTVGQPVMGIVNPRRPEGGAQAALISVDQRSVVPAPTSITLVEAATIPMNGMTALKAIEALGLNGTGTVLVTGGAGGVGGYVIQLAKHAGLEVIADAAARDANLLDQLGADTVVPRGEDMEPAVRALKPGGVDGVIDGAQLGRSAWSLLKDGGTVVSLRGLPTEQDPRVRHHAVSVTQHADDADALDQLRTLVDTGVLTPRVARVLDAADAAEAHVLVERGGLRGRVVLTFDD